MENFNFDNYRFEGFITNYGEIIKIQENTPWYNHTKLAEKIVADDEMLQKRMAKSKFCIAIDFLIHEMGYMKVGNRKSKELVVSAKKNKTRAVREWMMIYESMGYKVIRY